MLCDKKRWIVLTIPIFFFVLVLWKAYRGLIYIFICPSPTSIQAPSMSSRISDDSPSIWFSHLSHWAFIWRAAWEEHVCPTILLLSWSSANIFYGHQHYHGLAQRTSVIYNNWRGWTTLGDGNGGLSGTFELILTEPLLRFYCCRIYRVTRYLQFKYQDGSMTQHSESRIQLTLTLRYSAIINKLLNPLRSQDKQTPKTIN